jgi:cytochrome P450 family 144
MMARLDGTLLLDPDVIDDPYPFYRNLHTDAPVWRVPGRDVFVVSSFTLVAEATSRVDDFSSNMRALLYRDEEGLPGRLAFGDVGVDALATADPPIHKLHREVVFSELVANRMAALESVIQDLVAECLTRAIELRDVDFMAVVGNVIPITIVSQLIGFPDDDPGRLLAAAFDSTSLIGATLSLSELETLVGRIGEIETWIAEQLAASIPGTGDDILAATARGVTTGALSENQACVVLHTLLSAGGESTSSLLGNAVRMLAEDRELQAHLRANTELIPVFAEEALRLESPFRFLLRSVPQETSIGGVEIPEGSTVLLFWGAANRDPDVFENPDAVVLDRAVPRRHVAFGRGIHHCVGAPLARMEARILLTSLLEQTSEIALDRRSSPEWVPSLMVRRHQSLPITVAPR